MDGFMLVNTDPREWPNWEELTAKSEKTLAREAFVEGKYNDFFEKCDESKLSFDARLNFLAYIWG
jgi:hypothetical protein